MKNTSHGFRKQFLTDEALKILHKAKELNQMEYMSLNPTERL